MTLSERIGRVVFGSNHHRQKTRMFVRAAAVVIGIDFATKALALLVLREGHRIELLDGALLFELAFNATALGTSGRAQADATGLDVMLGTLVCFTLTSLVALAFASSHLRLARKTLLVTGVLIASGVAALPVGPAVSGASGSAAALVPLAKVASVLTFNLLLLRLSKSRALFAILCVLASASLANVMNLVAHPRGVIDFIHIAALGRWFGIANIADYVMAAAAVALLSFLLVFRAPGSMERRVRGSGGMIIRPVLGVDHEDSGHSKNERYGREGRAPARKNTGQARQDELVDGGDPRHARVSRGTRSP